ncbi:MAG: MerR family transcriptional regulator [Planctomycetota bacterium]
MTLPEQLKPEAVAAEKRKLWKVGELAKQTGLTRQSLHQYALLGLLIPVDMTKGGQRLFATDAAERVKLIRNLLAYGYTLRDIRDIFFKKKV